jgi:protein arginine kinase activator
MKCQKCEKPATFHITEITDDGVVELHLCEDHARDYLAETEQPDPTPAPTLAGVLAEQIKSSQSADELKRLDQRSCPVCGITFFEFRSKGRLGCPHDYTCFESELAPLIVNIHGANEHTGKRPKRGGEAADKQTTLIRLRREMKDAVECEDYEQASRLRDEIREIEQSASQS